MMSNPNAKPPVYHSDVNKLKANFQNNTNSLSLLPNHITPPSGLTKFIARNPFEADLTSKLHISILSPTVFKKVVSPVTNGSPGFTWSIDEIAHIQPAKIDEFSAQQIHFSDPEIEKTAQDAINKFFSENEIIPSPFNKEPIKMELPTTPVHQVLNSSRESYRSTKDMQDNSAQTILTLPPQLPPNVEEALKPYFTYLQDQNCENEEANSSINSLRRKLFDDHDDSQQELDESNEISPVKSKELFKYTLSPPQSGMFFHGTPLQVCVNSTLLKNCSRIVQRTFGTPLRQNHGSSPCNFSPISTNAFDMSCQSVKSQNRSVIKLNFTEDMSIEVDSEVDGKVTKCPTTKKMCSLPNGIKDSAKNHLETGHVKDVTIMSVDNFLINKTEDKEDFVSNSLSYFSQQSAFKSAQDTGYQTFSGSNITSNMDCTSLQKNHWLESKSQIDEVVQLDNIKNMRSSTPSKFIKNINCL